MSLTVFPPNPVSVGWEQFAPVVAENGVMISKAIQAVRTLPPAECPVVHRFTTGMYIRELRVPKGTLVVTKLHKTQHPYVVSKGKMSVWTIESGVSVITAPHIGITEPGTQRVAYAHEDTIWVTFHPSNKTNLDDLELDLIQPQPELTIPIDAKVINELTAEC